MLWVKAFHIIFIVCWFAGIFYLPRLFVYYALAEDKATQQHLQTMQRKLYNFITPFAALTLFIGLYLVTQNSHYYLVSVWFHIKMACVILLFIYHFYCGRILKQLERGEQPRSHIYYRIFNELPVLLLFVIVIMVVVKPF